MKIMSSNAKPFVKWAGGKGQVLNEIRAEYPANVNKYCELFVGGGAVLFDILSTRKFKEVLINDINAELINTYVQIRDNVKEFTQSLSEMQQIYWEKGIADRKVMYYANRERFNTLKKNEDNSLEKAVLFLFLNKTCFNGLYRVNKRGCFNASMGKYKTPLICDAENLKKVSEVLQGVEICRGGYNECAEFIDENTFVYLDPPYRPLIKDKPSAIYTENVFDDEAQVKLSQFIHKQVEKGAKVILSNSDPKNRDINDNFFDDLYADYRINRITATRTISGKCTGRKYVTELLIVAV